MARGEITGKKPGQTADEAKRLPGRPIADATAIEPTTKSESDSHTKGKTTPIRGPPVPPAWYSVREFCLAHRLSISMYFKLKAGAGRVKHGRFSAVYHLRRRRQVASAAARGRLPNCLT